MPPESCPTCHRPLPGAVSLDTVVSLVAGGVNTVRQVAAALYGPEVTPATVERARRRLAAGVRAGLLQVVDPGGPYGERPGDWPALYGLTAAQSTG